MARQREIGFSQIGRRIADLPALDDARRIADLERKIGQLTLENESQKMPYSTLGISGDI